MSESNAKIYYGHNESVALLKLTGTVRFNQCSALESFLNGDALLKLSGMLVVDLSETELLDSTALGLLAKIALKMQKLQHKKPELYCPENDVKQVLLAMSLDQLFDFIDHEPLSRPALSELRTQSESEEEQTTRVLTAHKTLMGLSSHNQKEFQSVVDLLESSLKGN